ncbi:MAG TPA: hypothetical protein VGL81_33895 [Polyangiaceae bacterium]
MKRAENLAPWLAGLLLAMPVLLSYYPPMTDLPFHEAAIAILRDLHDATKFPPGLYVLNLGEPNQLFHMLGWPLAYPFGSRWAVKLVVAGAVVAVPVCAARFARHVGASPLAALVVAPIALGWLFTWGLIANLLGLAALLATLPVLDRYETEPSRRRGAGVLGALVLLYFAHEAMMFVYAGAALLFAAFHPLSWKRTPARTAPFFVGIAITAAQAAWQKHLMSPTTRGMPLLWHPVPHKVLKIPFIILPTNDSVTQLSLFALCAATVAAFFWLRARERRTVAVAVTEPAASSRLERTRRSALRYRWEVLALGLFAGYLAFPLTLNSATLVYQRWFPPAFAVFVVVAAPRDLWIRSARVARLVPVLLPIATLLVTWPSFADSGRAYQHLDELIPLIEPGTAVAELDLGPGDPSRTFSLGPSGGRVLAMRGARLDFAFTDSPISPVIIPKEYRWNESLFRLAFDCWAFRPEHDFKSFRYALVRTSDPGVAALAQMTLAPEGRYVATAGEWVLFESTLPVIPPMSPPVHMPKPPPEEMRDRATRIIRKEGGMPTIVVPPEQEPDLSAPNGQKF